MQQDEDKRYRLGIRKTGGSKEADKEGYDRIREKGGSNKIRIKDVGSE